MRADAYRELAQGQSVLGVAQTLGISQSTIKYWARMAGMELQKGRVGGARPMPVNLDPPVNAGRAYRRLTQADRAFIHAARAGESPLSMRAIARELGISASTVSRELRAHQVTHWGTAHYDSDLAHYRALTRRLRPRPKKLDDPALRAEVVSRLNLKFSPQQIAADLKRQFPDQAEMHVSHETIYQALYVQGKGALRHELTVVKALRTGRKTRIPQSKLPPRTMRPWLEGARLSDRPAQAKDRAVPGHWEGDLVVGPANSGIITLVERTTRFALIGKLPGTRDSTTVTEKLADMITDLPAALRASITWDQGQEMAQHAAFTVKTGCPVFFCDPHSPWQRGTNENTNGLIRDFYPKGTNFNTISDDDLAHTQHLLNIRPRQTLQWHTPSEMLNTHINVALTT